MSDEKQKDKKNLFVVTYNPETKERKFVKSMSLHVDTRVETLAFSEHINLGIVRYALRCCLNPNPVNALH